MQVQVLVQMQVHVPDVVFCGLYEVLCSCSLSRAGAGAGSLIVSLLVCEFCEALCACASAGAESGAGQLQVQFQEQVTKVSIR